MVAVRSRCGHDVVAVWWCYWSDAPCIRHAPYCDVQDANEMRTVEIAKRNETYGTDTRDIRDRYGTIALGQFIITGSAVPPQEVE